jgi:hypothetical protein
MKEKIQSITFEYESHIKKLSGKWAEQWLDFVNGVVAFNELRNGNINEKATKHEWHDHWEIKTKQQQRKEKLNKLNEI